MDSSAKTIEIRLVPCDDRDTPSREELSVLQQNVYLIRPPEDYESRKVLQFSYEPLLTPTSIRLVKLHPLDKWDTEMDIHRPIYCSLIHVDLDEFPKYDALSYTWGDPLGSVYAQCEDMPSSDTWSAPAFDIYCNGQQISVTTNLYTALLALRCRYTGEPLEFSLSTLHTHRETQDTGPDNDDGKCLEYIWIDQICINQTDYLERNKQVQMMTRLYQQSRKVHVWLGGYDECARAAQYIQDYLKPLDWEKAEEFRSYRILDRSTYEILGIRYISAEQWIRLFTFLNRTWFQRAWIVQEVGVARIVHFFCGLFACNFISLAGLLEFLKQSGWIEQMFYIAQYYLVYNDQGSRSGRSFSTEWKLSNRFNKHFLSQIADIRHRMGANGAMVSQTEDDRKRHPLLVLLKKFRIAQTTDPRDKVYAFIGLSKEFADGLHMKRNAEFIPDYRKSPRDVYIESAKFIMSLSGNLEHLSLKEDESLTSIKSLPSWVPDFSVDALHNPINFEPYQWSASYPFGTAHIQYKPKNGLEVRGVKVGDIGLLQRVGSGLVVNGKEKLDHTDEVLETGKGLIQFLRTLPEASFVGKSAKSQNMQQAEEDAVDTTEQSRFEVFWRTVLTDYFEEHHPAPNYCGEALLTDMEYVIYVKMAIAMNPSTQREAFLNTGIIDWELLTDQIGQGYTDWEKLQGHYPYD